MRPASRAGASGAAEGRRRAACAAERAAGAAGAGATGRRRARRATGRLRRAWRRVRAGSRGGGAGSAVASVRGLPGVWGCRGDSSTWFAPGPREPKLRYPLDPDSGPPGTLHPLQHAALQLGLIFPPRPSGGTVRQLLCRNLNLATLDWDAAFHTPP
ncbi:hypothetical protein DFJ74DRAFT_676431 [Hyaloraphidium curvatum]|nr:hypothetical protein DFJ74DRAFT_698142 [Hyaloraphidium curvatum]KAI9018229.1 hypothetical protein DFJ74DRAFT_676431 [Hyaloraphidium curvatum]